MLVLYWKWTRSMKRRKSCWRKKEAKRSKKANAGNSKPRKSLYKKNLVSRLAAKFLQNYERIIIETVINQLVERKKMVKNRFIYTYDGF